MSASISAILCSNWARVASISAAANDSVNLISLLQFGQTIVGSFMLESVSCKDIDVTFLLLCDVHTPGCESGDAAGVFDRLIAPFLAIVGTSFESCPMD